MALALTILTYGATVLAVICTIIAAFARWRFGHWRRLGVPHAKPTFPFGNWGDVFMGRKCFTRRVEELYKMFEGEPYFGAFLALQPVLFITDPELIKDVTVKFSYTHFVDHISQPDEQRDPLLARNLFMLKGQRWRTMRGAVNPAFTSGKMKIFHPHVLAKAVLLSEEIFQTAATKDITDENTYAKFYANLYRNKDRPNRLKWNSPRSNHLKKIPLRLCTILDSKFLLAKFTTDAIATCAFGLDVDSIRNPDNDFYKMGLRLFEQTIRQQTNIAIVFLFPTLVKVLKTVFVVPEVASFFRHLFWGVMGEREAAAVTVAGGEGAVGQPPPPRGDYIDFLIGVRRRRCGDKGDEEGSDSAVHAYGQSHSDTKSIAAISKVDFDDDDFAAQAFSFYLAGYETTSTLASFALFEMAANPGVQEKLHAEIDAVLAEEEDRKVTYEAILKIKYLDMVISEVLRKYPPFPTLDRVCTLEYRRPDLGLAIAKGTQLMIPIYGLHTDPKFFPEPEAFDPERFTGEGKRGRPSHAYMPFGEGPRICVGIRFAQLQLSLALVCLLSRLRVSLTDEHRGLRSCPFSRKGFLLSPLGGLPLLFERRLNTGVD